MSSTKSSASKITTDDAIAPNKNKNGTVIIHCTVNINLFLIAGKCFIFQIGTINITQTAINQHHHQQEQQIMYHHYLNSSSGSVHITGRFMPGPNSANRLTLIVSQSRRFIGKTQQQSNNLL